MSLLTPTPLQSPNLLILDPPTPPNLLDDDNIATHQSISLSELDPLARSFIPPPPQRPRASSIPRTPEPLVTFPEPFEVDFSSFPLDISPPSPAESFTTRPPTPLEQIPGFGPSPLNSRQGSPAPRSYNLPLVEYDLYAPGSARSSWLFSDSSPDLTPDSGQSVGRKTYSGSSHPSFADDGIIRTDPKDVAKLFQYNYLGFPFPTEALSLGDSDYKLPAEIVDRLVDIDSDDDEVNQKTGSGRARTITLKDYRPNTCAAMDRLANGDTAGGPETHLSGIAIAQDDPFFQSSSQPFSLNGHPSNPDVTPVSPYQLYLSRPSPRTTIPAGLLDPSDSLQITILQSWRQTEPSQNTKDYCQSFLTRLTHTINDRFVRRGDRFKVDVFGSVSWGGETGRSGDLDLVILDRDIPDGYRPSFWRTPPGASLSYTSRSRIPVPIDGLSAVYNTYKLAACLTDAGMVQVQPIAAANTPIVKFVDPVSQMQCDINVNDLGGWFNSSLILHYCQLAPYLLRPMIHALKLWAAAFYVNDSSGQKGPATMSSYCLTLMAIAYLQHRGCLPNLQANVRVPVANAESDPDVVWVAWSREQGVPAHVAFDALPPTGWSSKDSNLTVADAIRGFFSFFSSRGQFQTERQVVSTLQGGIVPRAKSYGQVKNEESQFEQGLRDQGWSMDVMQAAKRARNAKFYEEEQEMGKGDRGIQPRKWSESRLVVQDPFLWQKNCASMMTNVGLSRWQEAVDAAHRSLTTNSRATVEDLTFNPNPPEASTPRRRRRGGGEGGGGSGSSGRGSPMGNNSSRGRGRGRGRLWNS